MKIYLYKNGKELHKELTGGLFLNSISYSKGAIIMNSDNFELGSPPNAVGSGSLIQSHLPINFSYFHSICVLADIIISDSVSYNGFSVRLIKEKYPSWQSTAIADYTITTKDMTYANHKIKGNFPDTLITIELNDIKSGYLTLGQITDWSTVKEIYLETKENHLIKEQVKETILNHALLKNCILWEGDEK